MLASFGKIDAGFDGTLTFAGLNSSASVLELPVGETFAQLVVEELTGRAEVLYAQRSGHYHDQRGVTLAASPDRAMGGGAAGGTGGGAPLPELMAPCLEMGCCKCCLDTEMPLTEEDVARLEASGHDASAFVVAEEGYTFLANVRGQCFFLDAKGMCSVYAGRPEGCRLYPLVMDEDMSEFKLDDLCPHRSSVGWRKFHEEALMGLLERLARGRD